MTATNAPRSVSVVISCYNHARFIAETVESALRQTYPHVEVVVVDDGSQDRTSEVVARCGGARYMRQQNQGIASARNNGLRATTGAYVTFLDGDDRLLPDAVSADVRELDSRPDSVFVSGRCRLIDADGASLLTDANPRVERDHYLELLRRNYIWMSAQVMFRRKVLEEVGGFDPAADHAGDYDLYLKIARRRPIYDYPQTVAEWRQHPANMSHNAGRMLKCVTAVHKAQRDHVKGMERYEEAYREGLDVTKRYYGELVVESVRTDVRERRWRRAAHDLLTLTRYCPRDAARHIYRNLRNTVVGKGAS